MRTHTQAVREGVFIYANGSNPYEGGVFYQVSHGTNYYESSQLNPS